MEIKVTKVIVNCKCNKNASEMDEIVLFQFNTTKCCAQVPRPGPLYKPFVKGGAPPTH